MNGVTLKCSISLSKRTALKLFALEILRSNSRLHSCINRAKEDYKISVKPWNYIPRRIKKYFGYIDDDVLWCILNNKPLPVCPNCRAIFEFKGFNPRFRGFKKTCFSCNYRVPNPTRGKTYMEIYGTNNPKCGFRPGENNVAKRSDIRQKISENIKASYTEELRELRRKQALKNFTNRGLNFAKSVNASDGKKYRSKLEVDFVNWVRTTRFEYEYEVPVFMNNGHLKIVDFIINGDIFIEISGYAFSDWRDKFDDAIENLRKTLPCNKPVLILTYDKFVNLMKDRLASKEINHNNFFVQGINDKKRIYKKLSFLDSMNLIERKPYVCLP